MTSRCTHPYVTTEETGRGLVRWDCLDCPATWTTHTDDD